MAAEPFATWQDVEARWRTLTPAEQMLADTLAGDASLILRGAFGDIDSRIASGSLDSGAAVAVVAQMVKRAMMAASIPDGAKSVQESVGPVSYSVSYENAAGNLFLTAVDRELLGGSLPRARSVRMGGFGDTPGSFATTASSTDLVIVTVVGGEV